MSIIVEKAKAASAKKVDTKQNTVPKENNTDSSIFSTRNKYETSDNTISKENLEKINNDTDLFNLNSILNSDKQNNNGAKDGKIDKTQQGKIGDCWLLSAVNALNYTEKGREIIKNAFEYNDSSTKVHFAFADYEISNSELENAKAQGKYSTGDDDMIILELATEKLLKDINEGNLVVLKEQNNPTIEQLRLKARNIAETPDTILNGGTLEEGVFLLTGKLGLSENNTSGFLDTFLSDTEKSWLEEFQNNGNKDLILTADLNNFLEECKEVKDVNGKDIKIYSQHAYAIKEVNDDTITVVNPWNSNEDIVISKDTFYDTFTGVSKTDLTDNNPKRDLIVPRSEIVPDDIKLENHELYQMANLTKEERTFAADLIRKYPKFEKTDIIFYSANVDNDMYSTQILSDFADGTGGRHINRILTKKLKGGLFHHDTFKKCLNNLEKLNDGNKYTYYQRILDRHLIINPYIKRDLGGDDIYYLSQISDSNWDKAMEYLKSDSKMSGKEIYKLLS